ncbi:MAG TPA: pyrroline-5-carboxylate reductase [Planctomycetota bacterium]|jgi:pyrroline-5-carboxylate reductase|nr:pyrroline-5-carboxylate reductase [Planctomycetota bacterium]OQC19650.1 MAG: Pyrroline-5-carboxylate reductase [Planctomycetes bacterium ADurb.Bin069]NMD35921.1 pyrroline-5-carboxylate reductase [Planctomycetota bacterium]HNR97978.1 pyrroline-5-carboxylate reductase [Planctomycetota bacterium]HNU24496.1 pyrroline-5-carboxylate reductase [Planctomycetota bacterium]
MLAYKFGVIGAGNMGTAIVRGLVESEAMRPNEIVAHDPNIKREQVLALELGVLCAQNNLLPASCPHLLLSVKPQMIDGVLEEIEPVVTDKTVVISIAAGITTAHIDAKLKGKGRIIRAMPNTPMLVGSGVSAVAAGPRATHEDVHWAQRLFATSGLAIVMDESAIDAVTGVSGSGPAYLFYLIEAMTEAGVAEGLDPDVAELLATQTCIGAGKLLAKTKKTPQELRAMVTTPGGTTQAAITHMEKHAVRRIIVEAISKATMRSRELGN